MGSVSQSPADTSSSATANPGTDGIPATSVSLNHPSDMAKDSEGNLLIADTGNNLIRKMDPNGMITTIAGTGEPGFSGDGGPAIHAKLNYPQRLALDREGNIFFTDTLNNRIRKIDTDGTITTVAGTGEDGYSSDGGPAVEASIYGPNGVYADPAGNLFITDYFNQRIRKVDTNGIITTIAGNGETGFSGDGRPAVNARLFHPSDLCMDRSGNIFFVGHYSQRVRKVDTAGIIRTIVGNGASDFTGDGGPAVNASLNGPLGICLDGQENLYIADMHNHRIRKVDSSGIITTVAGSGPIGAEDGGFSGDGGPAINARLNEVKKVYIDNEGNLFIADQMNNRIRMVDLNGIITTVAGNGDVVEEHRFTESAETTGPWYSRHPVLVVLLGIGFVLAVFAIRYFYRLSHLEKMVMESTKALSQRELDLLKEKEARLLVEKEIQFISEREQNRIGQDIHDGVIQQLSGVKMLGEAILSDLQKHNELDGTYVHRLNELLLQSIQQLRGLSKGLYPVNLQKSGLHAALKELASTVNEIYKTECMLQCSQPIVIQDEMVGINVFRIVQEAVNNAVKHSASTRITIGVNQQDNRYVIAVNDNGSGFSVESALQSNSPGMGLNIMKYRADIIGADLSISSQPGKGTTVQCMFQSQTKLKPSS